MIVILYVMDALRPDYVGCYGFHKDTTPNIDLLANDGVLYERAYATATWTKPSAASIVSSQYPRSLKMMHQTDVMPASGNTLPEVLKSDGFQTYAISANPFFSPDFGFAGFDEFFVLHRDKELLAERKKLRDPNQAEAEILEKLGIRKIVTVLSEDINAKIFPLLDSEIVANKLIIAWSADTHGPYYVRGEKSFFGNSPREIVVEKDIKRGNLDKAKSLYCDMLRYNDYQFGRLVAKLRSEGVYDDCLIIVTSDHGESFGEHESILGWPIVGHTGIAYEEVIRVPLVVKYPENKFAGQRWTRPVQLTDIYPTIVDVGEVSCWSIQMEGVSLVPSEGRAGDERTVFVESQLSPDRVYSAAVIRSDYKLIKVDNDVQASLNPKKLVQKMLYRLQVPSLQLYDLASDPKETRNLATEEAHLLAGLIEQYRAVKAACDVKADDVSVTSSEDEVSEEVKERLRALGYFD